MTIKKATLIALCAAAAVALNNLLLLFGLGFNEGGYPGHILNHVLLPAALAFFLLTLYRKQP